MISDRNEQLTFVQSLHAVNANFEVGLYIFSN